MVEGARLESVFTVKRNVGSNPTPSVYKKEERVHLSRRSEAKAGNPTPSGLSIGCELEY